MSSSGLWLCGGGWEWRLYCRNCITLYCIYCITLHCRKCITRSLQPTPLHCTTQYYPPSTALAGSHSLQHTQPANPLSTFIQLISSQKVSYYVKAK